MNASALPPRANDPYARLEQRFRRIAHLGGAAAILDWDSAVMMPPGGAEARGNQLSALKLTMHELITDPAVGDLLDAAEAAPPNDPWCAANLGLMRRQWRHANALPADLVEALSHAGHACEMTWRAARQADDFKSLAPSFGHLLGLVRQAATAKAEAFGTSRYDALLDEYEPGGSSAVIDGLFAELEAELPDLLDRIMAAQASAPAAEVPEGPFSVEAQTALGRRCLGLLGFDAEHGRLDVSLHPFTGGVPDDVRITTRYATSDFTRSLMGTIHETGHALYERGLPLRWRDQPVGQARGMALHESQSLILEMQACRSTEFVRLLAGLAQEGFGRADDRTLQPDNLVRLYRKVQPGLIRVDADEVTYPLHVILRYRLERAMIDGSLEIPDLPGAWREGMRDLLGIVPPDDRDGCMQDIHWPSGSFGYFPTYTMGALGAAQLFRAARVALPGLLDAIGRGDFQPLVGWLRQHVHGIGSLDSTDGVMTRATGAPLGTAAFLAHLRGRYLPTA
ncbi:carboxypeptidase M32 [Zavarzinia sp. CC-PAN008]|uniref:carboxypeptidase M32 n=1 Tax=Zavarzinia sp. CC-PAN008 TaxID=3243332 RepID=UPI003F7465E5